jgi:phosphoglycolate phosphatase
MMEVVRSLVLFDIDGTLLDVHGAGRASFVSGLANAFGIVDDLHDVRFGGATDLGVLDQLRCRLPIPKDDVSLQRFFMAMNDVLLDGVRSHPATAYDSVVPALLALRQRGFSLALVTGNAKGTATTKLVSAGIDPSWFLCGAYGDEHADRNMLAALAVDRSGIHPLALVGDTPSDIAAAKHIGAKAIAVTTGSFSQAALVGAGADVVADSLWAAMQTVGLVDRGQ